MEGLAKQRHCFFKQHSSILHMVSSFLCPRLWVARAGTEPRAAFPEEASHTIRVEASTTGYISTAKAPK